MKKFLKIYDPSDKTGTIITVFSESEWKREKRRGLGQHLYKDYPTYLKKQQSKLSPGTSSPMYSYKHGYPKVFAITMKRLQKPPQVIVTEKVQTIKKVTKVAKIKI